MREYRYPATPLHISIQKGKQTMRTCLVEINGEKRIVALDQLPALVLRRLVSNDSVVWVDGKVYRVDELLRQSETSSASENPEGGDISLLANDLPNRFSSKQSHNVIPFYWGMLAVALFVILGVASIFATVKNGEKPAGEDVVKNTPATTQEESPVPDAVSFQDEGQSESRRRNRRVVPSQDDRQEEDEPEPKEVFRFEASNEFFNETYDDYSSEPKKSKATRGANASETTAYPEDWEDWFEESESYASDEPKPTSFTSRPYDSTPFAEGGANSLLSDYRGHDLTKIVDSLQRYEFRLPTSNFSPTLSENDAFFERHTKFLRTESLYGSLFFGSRLAYVMKNASEAGKSEEAISVEYDSSTQTMTARRSFKFSHGYSSVKQLDDDSKRRTKNYRVYFTLFVRGNYDYGLTFDYANSKSVDLTIDHWTLTNVSAKTYEKLKDSLRVLCVFQLGANGSSYSGFYGPLSGDFRYPFYALSADKLEFWLYDGATGEILTKFSQEAFLKGLPKWLNEKDVPIASDPAPAQESRQTWREVLREAVEPEDNWTAKTPSITIPDDAESLEDALTQSHDGDVILVRASKRPIPLRSKRISHGDSSEILCDHEVAVVGESGDPRDSSIEIPRDATLKIDLPGFVVFKGVTFVSIPPESGKVATPSVVVSGKATGRFRDCHFVGAKTPESTGVAVVGEHTSAEFWRCKFNEFEVDGLRVEESARATLEYCEFISGNRRGLSALSSSSVKVDHCRFDGNITGFIAEGGGGVVVSNSFFSRNRSNWSISSGSARACDTKDGNIVEK